MIENRNTLDIGIWEVANMFEPGQYEYGLKTGDLSEEEMIKIFKKANRNMTMSIGLYIGAAISLSNCTPIVRKMGA